jgi:hypothetical protein
MDTFLSFIVLSPGCSASSCCAFTSANSRFNLKTVNPFMDGVEDRQDLSEKVHLVIARQNGS